MASAKLAPNKRIRVDSGYMNAFMPKRGRMSNYGAEMMNGGVLMAQPILESSYMHNGFSRLICDKPAEEMTRAGFTLKDVDENIIQKIMSNLEELDAMDKINDALKWRRAFGGSLIVLGIDDGGELTDTLNEDAVNSIDFMRVYDKYEARPNKYYDDPTNSKFGEVELYLISPVSSSQQALSYDVHETRVLVFDGEAVPNSVRTANDGWGASVIQTCFPQLTRVDRAHALSLLLLERMQQAVHGIPNLSNQVSTPEGEKEVAARVNVVDMVRGVMNTVIIDAEETYDVKSMSLSGVKDVLEKLMNALSAVSSIPTFLMGEYIGGLSNGDTNKDGWYAQIAAWQNDLLRKPLDRLVSLLMRVFSDGGSDGGDYTIEFNPLYKNSDKDQADIDLKKEQAKKVQMETITGLVNGQIMDEQEGRDQVKDEYNLVGDAPEPEPTPVNPMVLNPGQKLVDPIAGQNNPAPVGKTTKPWPKAPK